MNLVPLRFTLYFVVFDSVKIWFLLTLQFGLKIERKIFEEYFFSVFFFKKKKSSSNIEFIGY